MLANVREITKTDTTLSRFKIRYKTITMDLLFASKRVCLDSLAKEDLANQVFFLQHDLRKEAVISQ